MDRLARRVVVLALIVFVGSVLDALLTLLYIQDGGGEANPLMARALAHSNGLFLGLKLSSTGLAVWVLAAHQQWPLAVWSLYGLAMGYGAVLISHLVLVFRIV